MVGVPRSKGCRICVQRRVKCDQTRPICLRCKKGNRPCPGYESELKFQDEGPKLRKHFQEAASRKAIEVTHSDHDRHWREMSSSGSSGSSSSPSDDTDSHDDITLQIALRERPGLFAMFENPDHLVFRNKDHWAPLIQSLDKGDFTEDFFDNLLVLHPCGPIQSPALYQQQLLYTFQESISPTNRLDLSPTTHNHGRWLSYLPSLNGTNSLLDNSVRACTMAHLGRIYHLEDLLQEARTHYGKALHLLSGHLADPEKGIASETLSATILLSFYEMFASDSDQAWVRHAGGAGTLMKLRGAARHRTGFDREIYLAYRHALVIQAFESEQPCFLDQPEWRQLSHDIHGDLAANKMYDSKPGFFEVSESFFLHIAPIPALVCDARNINLLLKANPGVGRNLLADTLNRAITSRANLKSIFMRVQDVLKQSGDEPVSRMTDDPVFPVRYEYVNVFIAASYTGYWTILMVLNKMIIELDLNAANHAMYRVEMAECARECCRSVAYMMTSSFLGPFFIIFALRSSLSCLGDETQRVWIMQQMSQLGNSKLSIARDMQLKVPHPDQGMPRVRQGVLKAQQEMDRV